MDTRSNNILAAIMIEQVAGSEMPWAEVDKSKLPRGSFLWVEDPAKKTTWHLPYREGTGGIDPKTGMFKQVGEVNLNALRAIAQAVSGARTGKPMVLPEQIRTKIKRLLKKYKIGEFAENRKGANRTMKKKLKEMNVPVFQGATLDTENCILKGMSILTESSQNCSYKGGKGRKYSLKARQSAARFINGKKAYLDHQTSEAAAKTGGVRSLRDFIGVYENGRVDQHGMTRADLKYLATANIKDFMEGLFTLNADGVGGSIVGSGETVFDENTKMEIVEDITELFSTDLVSETGSTHNLRESEFISKGEHKGKEAMEDYSKITLSLLQENRPDLMEKISKEFKISAQEKEASKALQENLKTLKEENKELKNKLDAYEVKALIAKKESEIQTELDESKMKPEFITDTFRESLSDAKDAEARKRLIEDRMKIVEATKASKAGVKGMGDESKPLKEGKGTDEEEDDSYTLAIVK
jgi:hypothetical protein